MLFLPTCLTFDAAPDNSSNWNFGFYIYYNLVSLLLFELISTSSELFQIEAPAGPESHLTTQTSILFLHRHQNSTDKSYKRPQWPTKAMYSSLRKLPYLLRLSKSIRTRLTDKSGSDFEEETSMQKFKRRLKEEPLIPLGIFLYSPLLNIKKKNDTFTNSV